MKKKLSVPLMLFLAVNCIRGQNLIAIHHNGKTVFTQYLDSAIKKATDGDTIYLPGGNFAGNINISKSVYLIGAGFNEDSSKATYPTKLFGSISIKKGSSYISINGLSLTDIIGISDSVNNILIKNCYIGAIVIGNKCNNISIINNISGDIACPSNNNTCKNIYVSNNIINGSLFDFKFAYIANNILLDHRNNGYLPRCDNNEFLNNIFLMNLNTYSTYSYEDYYNIFKNNMMSTYSHNPYSSGPYANNSNSFYNNILGQIDTNTFVNGYVKFSSKSDYRLKSTSPGKNAGTNGSDIGIYGGAFPWKDGNIPFNPHVQTRLVAPVTKVDGKLPVKIKVKVQSN